MRGLLTADSAARTHTGWKRARTGDFDDRSALGVDPFAVDVGLRTDEGRVLEAELRARGVR